MYDKHILLMCVCWSTAQIDNTPLTHGFATQ